MTQVETSRIHQATSMNIDQATLFADSSFIEVHPPDRLPSKEFADELGKSVFGQEEACNAAAEMIINAQSGFWDGKRPLGSAVFLGPTGVGKTELAKAMARLLFSDENRALIIDGTTLQESSSLTRLKGSDPKYVGFGGEVLIMPDKVKDGAVIVVDEVEKAHPEVWKWFMPLLETGKTTLFLTTDIPSQTGVVGAFEVKPCDLNVSKCFIIFTSNEGAADMQDARKQGKTTLGFRGSTTAKDVDYGDIAINALRKGRFRQYPEFLGRIDRFIVFGDLQQKHYGQVFDKFFNQAMQSQMENDPQGNVPCFVTDELKSWLIQQSNVTEYGAREIRSTLHRLLLQRLADYKVSKALTPGSLAIAYITPDGEIRFRQQITSVGEQIQIFQAQPLTEYPLLTAVASTS